MTDPTPALTEAEREAIRTAACDCGDSDCLVRLDTYWPEVYRQVARIKADAVAAALAPAERILAAWDAWDGSPGPDGRVHPDSSSPRDRDRLRAALAEGKGGER